MGSGSVLPCCAAPFWSWALGWLYTDSEGERRPTSNMPCNVNISMNVTVIAVTVVVALLVVHQRLQVLNATGEYEGIKLSFQVQGNQTVCGTYKAVVCFIRRTHYEYQYETRPHQTPHFMCR